MRALLSGLVSVSLLGCATDKTPFDATSIDDEVGSVDLKADGVTRRTLLSGPIFVNVPIAGEFVAGKHVGYTFTGERGLKVSLALDATDGSDPVLMLYGPQRRNGTWPRRLALSDDAVGLDSRIDGFALPDEGTYLVVATEYWGDRGAFELRMTAPGTECMREPTVSDKDPMYDRYEGTYGANDCTSDANCVPSGCSSEICAAESLISTCEIVPAVAGACGCVDNTCVWAETFCPRNNPGVGEECGPAGLCADGLICLAYWGFAGPGGPLFTTCEITCDASGACPEGLECQTIADGPGSVCRPIILDAIECGPSVCGRGQTCCNESCGYCTFEGESCTKELCL